MTVAVQLVTPSPLQCDHEHACSIAEPAAGEKHCSQALYLEALSVMVCREQPSVVFNAVNLCLAVI